MSELILNRILEELQGLKQSVSAVEQQLAAFQLFTIDQFDKLNGRMDKLDSRMDKLESRMDKLESRMDKLESRMDKLDIAVTKTNLIIENEIRPALKMLAEGQMTQQVQLDRIEAKVSTHDEIIFKRVK